MDHFLLFFCCRLRVEQRVKVPVVYLRFRAASDRLSSVDFSERALSGFCFPLGPEAVQPKEVQASEEYTFTLTHGDGQRFTAFARQIFPPAPRVGAKARLPQVICVVGQAAWCTFYFKVLQLAEQILKSYEGLLDSAYADLPKDSQLGAFLTDLSKQLATNPVPGEVLRVAVPNLNGPMGVSPPRYMGATGTGDALNWSEGSIELQVPPDCGNGNANSGIPLARLLFHLPVEGMLTLIASLLLERRIIFVARSRDTVTAAVQAAQALIYPFRWQHICLPLLPISLIDYLSAPMPFLVGLQADLLTTIRRSSSSLSEHTLFDLDLHTVDPAIGSAKDDGRLLPYGKQLASALAAVFKTVRSPTEYDSNPVITGVMQEYFVRLFGPYRRFIHDQATEPLIRSTTSSAMGPGLGVLERRGGLLGRDRDRDAGGRHARSESRVDGILSGVSPGGPGGRGGQHDDMLRGSGYYFDQPAFVAHRRSDAVRSFLTAARHSQMYHMFIQERLEMAASGAIELPTPGNSVHGVGHLPAHLQASLASASAHPSYSFTAQGANGGARGRVVATSMLTKSNSLNNLASHDRPPAPAAPGKGPGGPALSSSGAGCPEQGGGARAGPSVSLSVAFAAAADIAPLLPLDEGRSDEAASTSGRAQAAVSGGDPFEVRVERFPEHRRRLRERVQKALAQDNSGGPAGAGQAGGRFASRLRRHRRMDSEDLQGVQQALQQQGDGMRRITTYPAMLDLSTPSLSEPASYFLEWDMHYDDEDSASPSPRDWEHHRSWSGNSLHSESGDVGAVGPPASTRSARENTPLRRPSVPVLGVKANAMYSLLQTNSNDSPMPSLAHANAGSAHNGGQAGGQAPEQRLSASGVAAAAALGQQSAGGAAGGPMGPSGFGAGPGPYSGRTASVSFQSVFAPPQEPVALEIKDGVQVKTLADGHRVYDGKLSDMMKMAASDAKMGLLSLAGLGSPRASPRGRDDKRDGRAERGQQQPWNVRKIEAPVQGPAPPGQQGMGPLPPRALPAGGPGGVGAGGPAGAAAAYGPLQQHLMQQQHHAQAQGRLPLPGMPGGVGPAQQAAGLPSPHPQPSASASGPPPTHGMAAAVRQAVSQSDGGALAHGVAVAVGAMAETTERMVGAVGDAFSGFKDKMGLMKDKLSHASNKALGTLHTPGYKPQTTGEKSARFKAQLNDKSSFSLLAGADGLKLKQPHAPQRPLSLSGQAPMFSFQQPPATPPTPYASPAGPFTPPLSPPAHLLAGVQAPPPTPAPASAPPATSGPSRHSHAGMGADPRVLPLRAPSGEDHSSALASARSCSSPQQEMPWDPFPELPAASTVPPASRPAATASLGAGAGLGGPVNGGAYGDGYGNGAAAPAAPLPPGVNSMLVASAFASGYNPSGAPPRTPEGLYTAGSDTTMSTAWSGVQTAQHSVDLFAATPSAASPLGAAGSGCADAVRKGGAPDRVGSGDFGDYATYATAASPHDWASFGPAGTAAGARSLLDS